MMEPIKMVREAISRLASGWVQQTTWSDDPRALQRCRADDGYTPAPGPAGQWRILLGGSHHGTVACWWLRWLAPVEVLHG